MGHKVYVVGLGPGDGVYLTLQARAALEAADVLCGYTAYVALAAAQFPCKETYATGMREEIERCRWALATAAQGKTVALVCSGDAGVYGMAGLLLQMGKEFTDVDIEVVPGVTAALSGAALLGAPLGHDFCVISLSDLLTPLSLIHIYRRSGTGSPACLGRSWRVYGALSLCRQLGGRATCLLYTSFLHRLRES